MFGKVCCIKIPSVILKSILKRKSFPMKFKITTPLGNILRDNFENVIHVKLDDY